MIDAKFVLVTRGRTGSTAILDELNNTAAIATTQELFIAWTFDEGQVGEVYKWAVPFDLWKRRYKLLHQIFPSLVSEELQASRYLSALEQTARSTGKKVFGWKLLSSHFEEREYISRLILKQGYKAIYLRRNIASQVLSGIVANLTGVYNSKWNPHAISRSADLEHLRINVEDFKSKMNWERRCVFEDRSRLTAMGIDFVEITYEDYCKNKVKFFESIYNFLGLRPESLPPKTDYKRLITNASVLIANYRDIATAALEMGEPLEE